ncbi:MAG: DUF3575 domain-containing protein [Bacteroidales bacterium]|nr:DUF3575 domain-containing protein [Bacteroidales bacterium]
MKKFILLLTLLLPLGLSAQNTWAVKTNVLHDVSTLSLNVAGEYAFKPQWSAELSASTNLWGSWGGSRLEHVLLQPEVKYWFCEKFSGWFVDAHAIGGFANVGKFWDLSKIGPRCPDLRNYELRDALMLGLGVGGGYDFILNRHWNLELEGGLGYMFITGDEYDGATPELLLKGSKFDYFGPTKLAVSIVYLF